MKTFRYTHTDSDGNKAEGTLSADNKSAALAELSERGLTVLSLEVETSATQRQVMSALRVLLCLIVLSLISAGLYFGLNRKVESDSEGRKLMTAIKNNKTQDVVDLLKAEPALVHLPDLDGLYPIHLAIGLERNDMVSHLLKAGARLEEKGPNGATALLWALDAGSPTLVELLLERGAQSGVTDSQGNGPLHYAALSEDLEFTESFLGEKADPNAANAQGETALHWAARENSPQVALALVKAGGDPNVQDNQGRSPLHFCAAEGHLEVAETLLEAGSLKSSKDKEQKTAGDLAQDEGFPELAKLLAP